MNRRLQQFLSAENITQSEFADRLQVGRASVSHILAGRNKPGYDFLENMARAYPELNLEWLLLGKGRMYKGKADESTQEVIPPLFEDETPPDLPQEQAGPAIDKIVVFYTDGTFKEIR